MEYTRFLQTNLLRDDRKLIELEMGKLLTHATTKEIIAERIGHICDQYGYSYFGFQLIRYLHANYSDPVPDAEYHTIRNERFAVTNISAPMQASADDRKRYAMILSNLVDGNQYDPIDGTYARSLFEAILIQNRFLKKDGKLRPITKWDVYDIGRMLNLKLFDVESIACKSFADGALSGVDARNLIEKFSFAANLTKEERDKLLLEYQNETQRKRPVDYKSRKPGVTSNMVSDFSKLLNPEVPMDRGTWTKIFLEKLVDESPRLKGYSNTARIIFEQILVFAQKCASPEFYSNGAKDEQFFKDLKNHVNQALEDFTKKNGRYEPLPDETRKALVADILAKGNTDNLKVAYFSWSVPVWTGDGVKRDSLVNRLEKVLKGKIAVRKEDILIALFIACARQWEHQKDILMPVPDCEAEKINNLTTNERAKEIHSAVKNRLKWFINNANILLSAAYLDRFYLPHPTEAAISYAILTRSQAGGLYLDGLSTLEALKTTVCYSTTNPGMFNIPEPLKVQKEQKEQEEKEKQETQEEKEKQEAQERLFNSLNNKIQRYLYRCVYTSPKAELLLQIKNIAKEIQKVYVAERFKSIDIYFTELKRDGNIVCEYGFIPAINIGRKYQQLGDLPGELYEVLFGNRKITIPLRETRIPREWRSEHKVYHPSRLVEECSRFTIKMSGKKLRLKKATSKYQVSKKQKINTVWTVHTRYPEMKDLNDQLKQLVHARALLVLLQREIMALLRIKPCREATIYSDPIEDQEAAVQPDPVEDQEAAEKHEEAILTIVGDATKVDIEKEEERQERFFPFPVEISIGRRAILKLPALDAVTFSGRLQ